MQSIKDVGDIKNIYFTRKNKMIKEEEYKPLKKVLGSNYCLYSVIENKLEDLCYNQYIIYELLKKIDKKLK